MMNEHGIIELSEAGARSEIFLERLNPFDTILLHTQSPGAKGSVAASDAFFPFEDGPQVLLDAGVRAIVQPGGSMRDQLTVDACEQAGVSMYFTGTRHFAH